MRPGASATEGTSPSIAASSIQKPDIGVVDAPDGDPDAYAHELIAHWGAAAEQIVLACTVLVKAVKQFGTRGDQFSCFLRRLVTGRVLSENEALASFRANGKLSMMRKIGDLAEVLLRYDILPLLPAAYSIIYQICLLIEKIGIDLAKERLQSFGPEYTREEIIGLRNGPDDDSLVPSIPLIPENDADTIELFATHLTSSVLRILSQPYAEPGAMDRSFRRPLAAHHAGLVVMIPVKAIGATEREFLPLLGFGKPAHVFLVRRPTSPEIIDCEVVLVAERGSTRAQDMHNFPAEVSTLDLLTTAERLFPSAKRKCQLFASKDAPGWLSLIGNQNWSELPSIR